MGGIKWRTITKIMIEQCNDKCESKLFYEVRDGFMSKKHSDLKSNIQIKGNGST